MHGIIRQNKTNPPYPAPAADGRWFFPEECALLEHPDEHEALWGCLLCRYGVEYVEDPHTRRRMPTVHAVRPKPMQEQADFRRACEFAPPEVRAQYELDAAYIDDAQASIRQLAASCQPYDVFICHKTTKTGSHDKTEDFHRATSLYHFLKEEGVRTFFAPESLQSAAGANYEAGIYHALQTAKVMLVVCSDADYLTSAWVRSEWSRFLEMMEVAPDKQLIPLLYDHFSPSKLPKEFLFRRLQGLDMTEITAPQTLLGVLEKVLVHEEASATEPQKPDPEPVKSLPTPVRPEPMTPEPEPAKPQPEPIKPQPAPTAPPVNSEYSVTLNFPGLRPHWATVPEWQIVAADKKTVLADVKWNSTVKVPIASERTQIFFRVKPNPERIKRARKICIILLMIGIVMCLLPFTDGELRMSDRGDGLPMFVGGMMAYVAFLCFCVTGITVPFSPIIVTTGKTYDLSWRWSKSNNNFKVEEY